MPKLYGPTKGCFIPWLRGIVWSEQQTRPLCRDYNCDPTTIRLRRIARALFHSTRFDYDEKSGRGYVVMFYICTNYAAAAAAAAADDDDADDDDDCTDADVDGLSRSWCSGWRRMTTSQWTTCKVPMNVTRRTGCAIRSCYWCLFALFLSHFCWYLLLLRTARRRQCVHKQQFSQALLGWRAVSLNHCRVLSTSLYSLRWRTFYSLTHSLTYLLLKWLCLCVVSERVKTRTVLVLSDWHVHSTKPMFLCHQQTRLSQPWRQQKLHATLFQGSFSYFFQFRRQISFKT